MNTSHRAELHALGKSAGDQRRRDDGEHQLVDHEGLLRNGCGVVGVGCGAHSAQKDMAEAADEAVAVRQRQGCSRRSPTAR